MKIKTDSKKNPQINTNQPKYSITLRCNKTAYALLRHKTLSNQKVTHINMGVTGAKLCAGFDNCKHRQGDVKRVTIEEFNSDNTRRLNLEETKAKIGGAGVYTERTEGNSQFGEIGEVTGVTEVTK